MFTEDRDMVVGYLPVVDLTRRELALLPHPGTSRDVAARLSRTAAPRCFPITQCYIMRNTGPGREQLAWFLSRSEAKVSATVADLITS
jgi:hypothetical protein